MGQRYFARLSVSEQVVERELGKKIIILTMLRIRQPTRSRRLKPSFSRVGSFRPLHGGLDNVLSLHLKWNGSKMRHIPNDYVPKFK